MPTSTPHRTDAKTQTHAGLMAPESEKTAKITVTRRKPASLPALEKLHPSFWIEPRRPAMSVSGGKCQKFH